MSKRTNVTVSVDEKAYREYQQVAELVEKKVPGYKLTLSSAVEDVIKELTAVGREMIKLSEKGKVTSTGLMSYFFKSFGEQSKKLSKELERKKE